MSTLFGRLPIVLIASLVALLALPLTITTAAAAGATVSGVVFHDANGNNVQDNGESGLSATIAVENSSGTIEGTGSTVANGSYSITVSGLTGSGYTAVILNWSISGYLLPASGTPVNVTDGSSNTVNFALRHDPVMQGTVFHDANGNSTLDSGENGLSATVLVENTQGTIVAGGSTDVNGNYSFNVGQTGSGLTIQVASWSISNYFLPSTPNALNLAPDTTTTTNYPLRRYPVVQGSVFHDTNGNSTFDSGESGLSATVLIEDGQGNIIAGGPTDANGGYSINVPATGATYTAQIASWSISNYFLPTTPTPLNLTVEGTSTVNYPLRHFPMVQGTVFHDANGNSTLDTGEAALSATVLIEDSQGNIIASGLTDSSGKYSINVPATGTTYTAQIASWSISNYFLPAAPNALDLVTEGTSTVNYPLRHYPVVQGTVFHDLNGNAIQDSGESGLSATILIEDTKGNVVASGATDTNGNYAINVPATGTGYTAQIASWSIPGYFLPATPNPLNLVAEGITTINYGLRHYPVVQGTVFEDENNNKQQDSGEPVVAAGLQVADSHGTVQGSGASGSSGAYSFNVSATGAGFQMSIPAYDIPTGFVPPPARTLSLAPDGVYTINWPLQPQGATASLLRSVRIEHRAGLVIFHWRTAASHTLAGFDLYAGRHRLNARLIPVHRSPVYSARVPWRGAGPFAVRAIRLSGR